MFVSVLKPHSTLTRPNRNGIQLALAGAGEALASALPRSKDSEAEAAAFASLIQ